jgi:hypothetical protein
MPAHGESDLPTRRQLKNRVRRCFAEDAPCCPHIKPPHMIEATLMQRQPRNATASSASLTKVAATASVLMRARGSTKATE